MDDLCFKAGPARETTEEIVMATELAIELLTDKGFVVFHGHPGGKTALTASTSSALKRLAVACKARGWNFGAA